MGLRPKDEFVVCLNFRRGMFRSCGKDCEGDLGKSAGARWAKLEVVASDEIRRPLQVKMVGQ